jgi:hypothetical protein
VRRLLCRFFGHDRMTTGARRRVCLRCGLRETLQQYGIVAGWQEAGARRDPKRAPDLRSRR